MKALRASGSGLLIAFFPVGLMMSAEVGAEEPAAKAVAALSRPDAIRQTLANLEKQLQDHGGSWEKWGESLKPYRDDIRACLTDWQKYKWPWPAKKNYVFHGAAISVQLRDNLEDLPEGERPFDSILHFDRQLKALGIDLILALIPAKMSVYPDYMYAAVEGEQRPARAPEDCIVSMAVLRLMHKLLQNDVEVVDLHDAFREFRLKHGDDVPLFYVRDAHYLNRGAQLSAEKIAERLKRYDFVQQALAGENPYIGEKSARTDGDKADDTLLLIKDRAGQAYKNSGDSPVFVLGDSHLGYNTSTAPFSGQVAYRIGMPVSEKWKEGLAAGIPIEVARDSNLKKRRVVVVHYSERMLQPKAGKSKWPIVDLPGAKGAASVFPAEGQVKGVMVTGIVAEASPPPEPKALYPDYLMKFYLTKITDEAGKPISDGVVHVLAMHNRKILPVAQTRIDQTLTLRLTSWPLVEKQYGKIQTGNLPTVKLETGKPRFWGEAPGQPTLTAAELARVGEEDSPEKRAAAEAAPEKPAGPVQADPTNADWRLELNTAVSGKPLVIHLSCRNGKCQRAFGLTPAYNKGVHDVEASGLTFAEGGAKGAVDVTINPDAWVPKDGKPAACRFEMEAEVKDGKVTGTFQGKFGEADAKGAVAGVVEAPRDAVQSGAVELQMSNAIKGGEPHHRNATMNFSIDDGKPAKGSLIGFHRTAWSGKITALEVQLTSEILTGQFSANVTSGVTSVSDGLYTFTLEGKVVGATVFGKFKARYKGEELPGGAFSGTITPKVRPEAPAKKPKPKAPNPPEVQAPTSSPAPMGKTAGNRTVVFYS